MNLVSGNDFFKESYMKLKNSWILLLACLCLYSACREEQKTTQIIVKKQQVAAPKATQKMGDYQQSRPVEWLGAEYTVTVDLKADTSLPLVKEGNQKYYDNRIRLTITRSDKSQFFSASLPSRLLRLPRQCLCTRWGVAGHRTRQGRRRPSGLCGQHRFSRQVQ